MSKILVNSKYFEIQVNFLLNLLLLLRYQKSYRGFYYMWPELQLFTTLLLKHFSENQFFQFGNSFKYKDI